MSQLSALCNAQQWGLFLLRVILGITFILHGSQKVFGILGGSGLTEFATWMNSLNIGTHFAYLAAFAELIGGVMLLLGFTTEIGALLAGAVMIGAIFIVHGIHVYFVQNSGFEYPFVLLVLLVATIIAGPGKYATYDPFLGWRISLFDEK